MERWTGTPEGTSNVLRMFRETHAISAIASSTSGCEGKWSAFDPLPKLTQGSDKDVRIIIGKERESYELEFNYRIRGRTLRTESLDRGNAKDLAQVVQNPSQCEGFGMWALLIMSKGFYIEHLEMDFQHF